ncbi:MULTISPECIES: hypothetical protein [Yersinia]|uniref:hypothetical protein n=1 Tax=Yersinia TaxID=629 RepID=UPI000EB26C9A|nr:hypothetical protein [Yersinia sp. IP36721]
MSSQISISIPSAVVTPKEFASLENVSIHTVYSWVKKGWLTLRPKRHAHSRSKILYAKYKKKQQAEIYGHSNIEINIDPLMPF